MKAIICFLFPVLLFAQNPFPDTLILTNGRTYPCLITGISDSKIEMIYANNRSESVILKAVDQITIEGNGAIYKVGSGYTTVLQKVKDFVEDRNRGREEELIVREELAKLSAVSNSEQFGQTDNTVSEDYFKYQKPFEMKRWSFGVLLIPYYSGTTYEVVYYTGSYPPEFLTRSYANNEINMQGQLAFALESSFMLTLDVTYSSSFNETRLENHTRNEYNEYDYGYKTTNGLYMFDFSLGAKYYFLKFYPGNVNIYALAGFGKQFSSANVTDEDLFPDPGPPPIIEDNIEEYLEGLNSPWHIDFGFGAEYLFNESLSLNTNIRFIYSSVSSEYDYRYISEFETNTQTIKYSNSEFITRIGLGINFYF